VDWTAWDGETPTVPPKALPPGGVTDDPRTFDADIPF
jgi:hypothetical protein